MSNSNSVQLNEGSLTDTNPPTWTISKVVYVNAEDSGLQFHLLEDAFSE